MKYKMTVEIVIHNIAYNYNHVLITGVDTDEWEIFKLVAGIKLLVEQASRLTRHPTE